MLPTQVHLDTHGAVIATPAAADAGLESHLPALRQRLLRHARFVLGDEGTAEDLVQDTLIAVVQRSDARRGDSSLTTWAVAILKNKIADWYRSPVRRRFAPVPERAGGATQQDEVLDDDGRFVESAPAWEQPENRVEHRQMMAAIENCVSCLPPRTGRVFMLREWLGFDTAEVCERLSLSAENCRTMLHRARTSLRSCMQHRWIDGKAHA